MKLNPVFLLCLAVLVRSQPNFFAVFDFSVSKINGSADGKFSLYTNLMNDSDTVNLISGKEVYGDGVVAKLIRFNLSNDKTTPYTSAIVVFDNEMPTTRRKLTETTPQNTFSYQTNTIDDNLIVKFDSYGHYQEAFRIPLKSTNIVMALAINLQTDGNETKTTVYYMDSDGITNEATKTFEHNDPSLIKADFVVYDHQVGNLYYVGLSHEETKKSVFESWVDGFVNTEHKKAECSNCGGNMTCPANAHLRPLLLGMRKYKCTCKEDSAVYEETVGAVNCMKLATGKDCNFGCASGCASIDPNMCYANCTPGYNCTALKKGFVTCTPIPGDHKSIWFWLFVITIPIFVVAYIVKIIFFFVYKPPKATTVQEGGQDPKSYVFTGHNSPTASRIVTSGPGSPIPMHKKPGASAPDSEIDTYKPSLIKVEDDKEFNLGSPGRQSDSDKSNPNACKVCGDVKDELLAVFKCRHSAVCKDCLKSIKRCPICGNNALLLK